MSGASKRANGRASDRVNVEGGDKGAGKGRRRNEGGGGEVVIDSNLLSRSMEQERQAKQCLSI